MPYWEIVLQSFQIPWRHKYLWLLALFAGEGGGGFNGSFGQSSRGGSNPSAAYQQATNWLNQHLGLVVALVVLWLLLVVALFILAAVCEGALIRGSAEHDADRPFRLGTAWSAGVRTMWLIVRFRLLLIAITLPAIVILAATVAGLVFSIRNGITVLAVVLGILGALIFLAFIVFAIYLSFLDRLGARTAILEQEGAWASIVRGHRLLLKRLGRVLLVWLISIATAIVVGIALTIVFLILAIPLIIGIVVLAAGASAGWFIFVIGVLILIVVGLPVAGYVNAQGSTYWTLAFRRMDIEYPPAYAYAAPPTAPQT